jgi:DNA (cytosine-5)-methyltransferase 1
MAAVWEIPSRGEEMRAATKTKHAQLELVKPQKNLESRPALRTIDLFAGAGGITEGFRVVGYECLYANDSMPEAMETFQRNHPGALADCRNIEQVKPSEIRSRLGIAKGELDVLAGGPPCQGFSINAPERFLKDPRNKLFKDYEVSRGIRAEDLPV